MFPSTHDLTDNDDLQINKLITDHYIFINHQGQTCGNHLYVCCMENVIQILFQLENNWITGLDEDKDSINKLVFHVNVICFCSFKKGRVFYRNSQ